MNQSIQLMENERLVTMQWVGAGFADTSTGFALFAMSPLVAPGAETRTLRAAAVAWFENNRAENTDTPGWEDVVNEVPDRHWATYGIRLLTPTISREITLDGDEVLYDQSDWEEDESDGERDEYEDEDEDEDEDEEAPDEDNSVGFATLPANFNPETADFDDEDDIP